MKTRTINIYSFGELSDKAKQRAIDLWYEHEDYPFLQENLEYQLKELDKKGIFSDVKLQYSLSYCQGDGLSFKANIDISKWTKNKKVIEAVYSAGSTGNTGSYSYASESQIVIESENASAETEKKIDAIEKEIAAYYMDICRKLEKSGYAELEYRMDFKEFEEHAEANDYEYLENGEMA